MASQVNHPWSPTTPVHYENANAYLGGSPTLSEIKQDPFKCHYCHKYFMTVHDFPAYHCNYCNITSCCVNVACIRKLPESCSRYMTTLLKSQAELRLCIEFMKERAKSHETMVPPAAAASAAASASASASAAAPEVDCWSPLLATPI